MCRSASEGRHGARLIDQTFWKAPRCRIMARARAWGKSWTGCRETAVLMRPRLGGGRLRAVRRLPSYLLIRSEAALGGRRRHAANPRGCDPSSREVLACNSMVWTSTAYGYARQVSPGAMPYVAGIPTPGSALAGESLGSPQVPAPDRHPDLKLRGLSLGCRRRARRPEARRRRPGRSGLSQCRRRRRDRSNAARTSVIRPKALSVNGQLIPQLDCQGIPTSILC